MYTIYIYISIAQNMSFVLRTYMYNSNNVEGL